MEIKLIIFDLDGVLVDSRDIHYTALNEALREIAPNALISEKEHLSKYDGLNTTKKLQMLTADKGLDTRLHEKIWQRKQALTAKAIALTVKPNARLSTLFAKLKQDGLIIYVCSNAVRKTVETIITQLGLSPYVDRLISNNDVTSPKPHPEMYWQAMTAEKVLPNQTLIVEDSYIGRKAALSSGGHLCAVKTPEDVTTERLYSEMQKTPRPKKWEDKKMNVLIPMAGAGSRFVNAGYTFPKPLIDVKGQPMIKIVVDNLNVSANFIFIVQKAHVANYNLKSLLRIIAPGCKIIEIDGLTEGACCTTLLAKTLIDNDNPLLIANADQYIEWESGEFFHSMNAPNIDGGILTFENTHPKWSYINVDDQGNVTELREKDVISNIATVGIYYWQRGHDYVKYAEEMIRKGIKVCNEYYVAPTYNEAIADKKIIKTAGVKRMWGLGTPQDLDQFILHGPLV